MRFKAILKFNDFDEDTLMSSTYKYKAVCSDNALKITKYIKTSKYFEGAFYTKLGTLNVDANCKSGYVQISEGVIHDVFAIMLKKYGVKIIDSIPSSAISNKNIDYLFKKLDNAFKDDYSKVYCNLKTQNYGGEVLEEVLRGYRQSFSEKKHALKQRVDNFRKTNENTQNENKT